MLKSYVFSFQVIEIFTKSLVNRRALFDRETSSYSKYGLLMARDQFRKDPPSGLNVRNKDEVFAFNFFYYFFFNFIKID